MALSWRVGSKVSMPLWNDSNTPLNALEVCDSAQIVLDTLPINSRYVGQAVFCELENCVYRFTKHDDGTGTNTLTSGITDYDFQPDTSGVGAMKIASNTELGQVIIKLNGGINVDSSGYIWIDGYSSTTTTDPDTGEVTTTTTIGGITSINVSNPSTGETTNTVTIGGITSTTTDDGTGNISETATIGGVTTTTTTDDNGNKFSQVGDILVSGTKDTTTTTTTTDVNTGRPVNTTVQVVQTPTGTQQVTTTTTTDDDGNTVTSVETIHGGSDGIDVGRSDGTIETTVTNGDGGIISSDKGDVAYNNGDKEEWATKGDIDNTYDSIFGDLGWD